MSGPSDASVLAAIHRRLHESVVLLDHDAVVLDETTMGPLVETLRLPRADAEALVLQCVDIAKRRGAFLALGPARKDHSCVCGRTVVTGLYEDAGRFLAGFFHELGHVEQMVEAWSHEPKPFDPTGFESRAAWELDAWVRGCRIRKEELGDFPSHDSVAWMFEQLRSYVISDHEAHLSYMQQKNTLFSLVSDLVMHFANKLPYEHPVRLRVVEIIDVFDAGLLDTLRGLFRAHREEEQVDDAETTPNVVIGPS